MSINGTLAFVILWIVNALIAAGWNFPLCSGV